MDKVRLAFLRAVQDIADRSDMKTLKEALRDRDVEAAVLSLNIENAAFDELRGELMSIYAKTGSATLANRKWVYANGQKAVVRWNSLTPNAESYARYVGSDLITGISNGIRESVRGHVADGYALGRKYDRIALDIVGRIGGDGKRQGGIIGLTPSQQQWVANLRRYLIVDPKRALDMSLFTDKTYRNMIKEDKPLSQDLIDTITRRYAARMLKSRGLTIARTEVRKAAEMGRYEAWQQALEKTGIPERFVLRRWRHTGRAVNDRPEHILMNGNVKRGLNSPHVFVDGTAMLHPHDNSFGAGPKHIINCMCEEEYSVDLKGLRAWRGSQVQ